LLQAFRNKGQDGGVDGVPASTGPAGFPRRPGTPRKELRVHVPDGFLDASTSAATAVAATAAVGVALRRSQREVGAAGAPLTGLVAAFVFAAQMVNFPVGLGTSGHLLGGTLAAVLVGPWTAVLCLSVVLVVQALLFADGGLTALGTNVLLVAVVTVLAGYLVARAALALMPRRPASAAPAAFAGGLVSVPAAAAVFVGLYAAGGTTPLPLVPLAASMLGWHVLVGLGEAAITAMTVGAVVAARPDLVYLSRRLQPSLALVTADGRRVLVRAQPRRRSPGAATGRRAATVAAGVTALLAGTAGVLASAAPDGLERVAADQGFLASARDSAAAAGPLAGYAASGLPGWAATAAAGLAGVGAVLLLAAGVAHLVQRDADASGGLRRAAVPGERSPAGV
jgi:cobalt/nickel transport system permease protein